jgi:uncharacterized protein (TIGR02246 family)
MMRKHLTLLLAVLVLGLTSCADKVSENKPAAATPPAVDTAALRAASQKRMDALGKGDADGYLAAYSDTAVWMPPEAEQILGKAAARQHLQSVIADTTITVETKTDEQVVASPDWVLDRGTYTVTSSDKKSGKSATGVGSYLTTWHRESDGQWRIAFDIWNSKRPEPGK